MGKTCVFASGTFSLFINHFLKNDFNGFPDKFSSVTQRDLAVPSPPTVEKLYVMLLCKFVESESSSSRRSRSRRSGGGDEEKEEEEE